MCTKLDVDSSHTREVTEPTRLYREMDGEDETNISPGSFQFFFEQSIYILPNIFNLYRRASLIVLMQDKPNFYYRYMSS